MKSHSKKGSINLGISTIVVLVIAMVLIAAGISFIRGFFDLGEKKLTGAFEVGEFGLKPSRTDPLVLADGKIRVKAGTTNEEIVRVGYYNAGNSPESGVYINVTKPCTGGLNPIIDGLTQDVKQGESAGFQILFKPNTATAGTYICTLEALKTGSTTNLASTQIEVEVYS